MRSTSRFLPPGARRKMTRPTDTLVHDAKAAEVGGFRVRRALPRRGMRTVGARCFAYLMGPQVVTETCGLDVGPHPHIGLHTVTWLVDGAVLHTNSLGFEQLIRPGQLNESDRLPAATSLPSV
ncbi:MAG: pirin family protein [Actinobacteria bacterium]|nr:pirin family protein [Actinomycetota bacterium]